MSVTDLVPVEQPRGVDTYRTSTDAATLCGDIVKATATKIQGKRYVTVEGWQAIAVAHGCVASSRDVEMVEGGIRAIGEIRRMSDGGVIATAEGFLGDDEQMWAKRPMFARRAMAQTRAISRACRSAFAHVVILIDKSLGTTPAEEMMGACELDEASLGTGPRDADGRLMSNYSAKAAQKAAEFADDAIQAINLGTAETAREWRRVAETVPPGKKKSPLQWLADNSPGQFTRVANAYQNVTGDALE